jgi:hypothetical protein
VEDVSLAGMVLIFKNAFLDRPAGLASHKIDQHASGENTALAIG